MPDVLKNIDINILLKIIFVIVGIAVVFILAKVLAALVAKLIKKCTFIEKMFKKIDVKVNLKKVGKIVGKCVYFVLIACAIIGGLAYLNILSPNALGVLIDDYVLAFISAAVIALGAWILALLAKIGITKVLKTTDIDEKIGAGEKSDSTISESLAVVGFWGVILYFIPYVLAELGQDELLSPITGIINEITSFIPQLVGAGVIVAIAYFVGKFVAKIVTELLSGLGFDKVLGLVGIQNNNSTTSPSSVIGKLVFVYILLFAVLEAANNLGFSSLTEIINQFISFGSNILVGVVIFAIGIFLANLASNAIKSTTNSKFLPKLAKGAIIVLTSFMGLQQMGLGGDIINQAFTLLLGALAVAFALAVGLGSKEVAGEEVKRIIENMKK